MNRLLLISLLACILSAAMAFFCRPGAFPAPSATYLPKDDLMQLNGQ